ncbi:DNA-binding response regulator [Paenibacillus sambharensis]|uniref:DNA-binding response regulator n=1 Tax=Paenibacillus sambharensis TaxID=1803190 RepID=A0A2W1LC56_9BACL|nr:response regulator transcription factor [Paenibacillus sambharensis]PZD97768.1 DNA-binding response regulator [Paenibacillus sambharensis]
MKKILLVEDDSSIADMISIYLREEGYSVISAMDGASARRALAATAADLIILDIMLPDTDGMTLCAEIRSVSDIPILMLSARQDVNDRVEALFTGADDYLPKPFSMRELAARVEALLRRANYSPHAVGLNSGSALTLDTSRRKLFHNGKPVETTYHEFELMRIFLLAPGKVFSREELLRKIKGPQVPVTDRAIDVHITNLRKKLEANPKYPRYIKTVWGIGYKYNAEHYQQGLFG